MRRGITFSATLLGTGWAVVEVVNKKKGRTTASGDQRMVKNNVKVKSGSGKGMEEDEHPPPLFILQFNKGVDMALYSLHFVRPLETRERYLTRGFLYYFLCQVGAQRAVIVLRYW